MTEQQAHYKAVLHEEDETLSHEPETELWFLNYVPFWVVLPSLVTS